jgi:DNA-directed RNA polymerase subunit M/transcription elongation factor TFIIS
MIVVCDKCKAKFYASHAEEGNGYAVMKKPTACPKCGELYPKNSALALAQPRNVSITGDGNVVGDNSEANVV